MIRALSLLALVAPIAALATPPTSYGNNGLAIQALAAARAAQAQAVATLQQAQAAYSAAATAKTTAEAASAAAAAKTSPADVTSAINVATTGLAKTSDIPPKCSSVPAMDTTNGSVGTAAPCTPPGDNSRPATVQIATAIGGGTIVTAADGSWSGVWPRTWSTAPSYAHAEIFGSSLPYICGVITATTTTVSGKCWQAVTTALPGTLLALGQTVVNPLSAATAGLTVRVAGRQ